MSSSSRTPLYGGQALIDGVMMKGVTAYSTAVRVKGGSIEVEVTDLPGWTTRWQKVPVVRGVMSLAETMTIGTRALRWSTGRGEHGSGEAPSGLGAVLVTTIGAVVAVGIFGVAPALVARLVGISDGVGSSVVEGAIRLGVLIAYMFALGRFADIRRVFQYHGAEHKIIATYENGNRLTVDCAGKYPLAHMRCGTTFLMMITIISMLAHALVGRPSLIVLIASRIILLPLIAGISFEAIRIGARRPTKWYVKALMAPGLLLQALTTRTPDESQVEVALAALKAVHAVDEERGAVAPLNHLVAA